MKIMKELSIEEKAKAYDKAVERAIAWRKKYDNFISEDGTMIQDFDNIFPELAESEDEKIRKGLIAHLKDLREWEVGKPVPIKTSEHYDAWITWIEKQGQVKNSTISQHENKTCKENGDSLTGEDEQKLTWKPSKEQIISLRWVLSHIPYNSHKEEISGLLEQLKKLREE